MENKIYFTPTVEWITKNYDKYNEELFGGQLGSCDFDVKPLGIKSLGCFKFQRNIKCSVDNRMLYIEDFYGNRTYINQSNFAEICKPLIILSSQRYRTEDALFNTLIHEMCHYYTYCHGRAPKQGHGIEFKRIANEIYNATNGRFNITRLTIVGTEESGHVSNELQQRFEKSKSRKEKIVQTKLNKILAYIWFKDGETRLTTTSSKAMVDEWFDAIKENIIKDVDKIYIIHSREFNELLLQHDYLVNLRSTGAYYDITYKNWANGILEKYDAEEIYDKDKGFKYKKYE